MPQSKQVHGVSVMIHMEGMHHHYPALLVITPARVISYRYVEEIWPIMSMWLTIV